MLWPLQLLQVVLDKRTGLEVTCGGSQSIFDNHHPRYCDHKHHDRCGRDFARIDLVAFEYRGQHFDGRPGPGGSGGSRLLEGVKVLDLSAYLAGPIAPLVLAELGAYVVKVEPRTGDVHRNVEPMFAAGQRGKRTLAMDWAAPLPARSPSTSARAKPHSRRTSTVC